MMTDLHNGPTRAVSTQQGVTSDACVMQIARLITPEVMDKLHAAVALAREMGRRDLADALADLLRRLSELSAQTSFTEEHCQSELWLG